MSRFRGLRRFFGGVADLPRNIFRNQLLISTCLILLAALAVAIPIRISILRFSMDQWVLLTAIVLAWVSCLFMIFSQMAFSTWAFWIGAFLLVVGSGLLSGGLRAPVVSIATLLPLKAISLSGKKKAAFFTLGIVGCIVGLALADQFGWTRPFEAQSPKVETWLRVIAYSTLAVTTYFFGWSHENALAKRDEWIHELSRIADASAIVSGVSHEINNPLMAVLLQIDTLERASSSQGSLSSERIRAFTDRIRFNAERIAAITKAAGQCGGEITGGRVSRVSLRSIVETALQICEPEIRRIGMRVRADLPDQDIAIQCETLGIQETLIGLVLNSVEALEGYSGEKWIELSVRKSLGRAEVRVVDSGPGVPKKVRDRLFLPFVTTKEPGKGTGLTLATGARVLAEHGGRLRLDPHAEHTTFVMELPAAG